MEQIENKQIIKQLEELNKSGSDLFLFLLCKEGYTNEQIRNVVGSIDNNRLTKIRNGLNKKTNAKEKK